MSDTFPCCATFYERPWVHTLLGDSFHPGGLASSQKLIERLDIGPDMRVLDVACGTGQTAMALAERGAVVHGLDLSEANLEQAAARANARGLHIDWLSADASRLPLEDSSFDAIVCECAFSTFSDKPQAVSELVRVCRPGGRVGISDMIVTAPLPPDLLRVAGSWACVAEALDVGGYQRLALDAGLWVEHYEDESAELRAMIRDLKRKLVAVGLGVMSGLAGDLALDVAQARSLLDRARRLVDDGTVQYGRFVFTRGRPRPRALERELSSSSCVPDSGCC